MKSIRLARAGHAADIVLVNFWPRTVFNKGLVMNQWNDASIIKPAKNRMVRILYADGMECNGIWIGGLIWLPSGSDTYRYADVIKWRELS